VIFIIFQVKRVFGSSMNNASFSFEDYREYLRILAEVKINRKFKSLRWMDASDLVQETLLKAFRAAQCNRSRVLAQNEAQRAAWLRRILANTLAGFLRNQHRAKRNMALECSLEQALKESSIRPEDLRSSEHTPCNKAIRTEMLQLLSEAIARLPEGQREVLILRRYRGLSIDVIAYRTGRTRGSVVGLLRRAVQRLREDTKGDSGNIGN